MLLLIRRDMDTLPFSFTSISPCSYPSERTAGVSACVRECRLRVKTLVGAQEQVLLYIRREMDTLQSFATMLESELVEHKVTTMTLPQLNEYVSEEHQSTPQSYPRAASPPAARTVVSVVQWAATEMVWEWRIGCCFRTLSEALQDAIE